MPGGFGLYAEELCVVLVEYRLASNRSLGLLPFTDKLFFNVDWTIIQWKFISKTKLLK